jgi:hypothetical protein
MDTELAFDSSHPIPDVTAIDVTIGLAGGGADYGLVIARPLKGDERSLKRLEAKIQNYVGDFFSDESAQRYGTPNAGPMSIVVHIHQDSDPEVFHRLQRYEQWVRSKNIGFSLKRIETP